MSDSLHAKGSAILAKVIDLPRAKAIAKIESLCKDDKELKELVLELFDSISEEETRKENQKNQKHDYKKLKVADSRTRVLGHWTRLLLENKKNRLILMSVLFLLFLIIGFMIRFEFKNRIVFETREKLQAQLQAQSSSLKAWIKREQTISDALSKSPSLISFTYELDSLSQVYTSYESMGNTEIFHNLESQLDEFRIRLDLESIGILHKRDPICMLSTGDTEVLPQGTFAHIELSGLAFDYFRQVRKINKTLQLPPLHDTEMMATIPDNMEIGTFLSFISPIEKDSSIIGYMINSLNVKKTFSKIIRNADYGNSNKVYAFNKKFKILSTPRFEKDLQQSFLLNFDSTKTAINAFEINDPGGPIRIGDHDPKIALVDQTFTSLVDDALIDSKKTKPLNYGTIMMPYRDYRGIEVVGAWKWMPELGFGMIAEIDAEDANAPIRYFDGVLILFYAILIVLVLLIYRLNVQFIRFGRKIDDFQLLGHYQLLEKIGEGGFGQVYKARHQNLKSEVAVKLLKKELVDTDALQRFEKEVKTTSQLSHPNTIKVFDYGTSDEGQFYYVMEFLNGVSLEACVNSYESFPVSRSIYILLHVCYSIREAHSKNLIHRDIKPANIMLCNQGGFYDLIKVLDFGLVKDLDSTETQQTQINRIGGTPMFMSPERLRDPFNADQRVDIYAIGAMGLYMLSGQYVVELISQKMLGGDATLSGNLRASIFERKDIPEVLSSLLLQCIHFNVEKRPADIDVLISSLETLSIENPWTRENARNWWLSYDVYGS